MVKSVLEHRLAIFASFCTFCLLLIGATVNPTGSSLACPEPTLVCHGELFPRLTGGVLYEHGHRLFAMSVGFIQIALTIVLLRRRKDMKALAWGGLALILVQGALGAITVAYKLPDAVSTSHLICAFSYLALNLYIVHKTRPYRKERDPMAARAAFSISSRKLAATSLLLLCLQIVLGGLVRHADAALSCIDFPACEAGAYWSEAGLQQLHMVHRGFGILVALFVTVASVVLLRRREWPSAQKWFWLALVGVWGQVGLGIYTILSMRAVPVAVLHFGGAAVLFCTWVHVLYSMRGVMPAEMKRGVPKNPRTDDGSAHAHGVVV